MTPPLLISIEGIHGAGKSTIGSMLSPFLRAHFASVVHVHDQKATPLARRIRDLNLTDAAIDSISETLLVAAARREVFVGIVKPQLAAGACVLIERFVDSFFAFGFARRTSSALLTELASHVSENVVPRLTILLDVQASVAMKRLDRSGLHRVEREPLEFHERLREGYLQQARRNPGRTVVLDASVDATQMCERVERLIADRFELNHP